MQQPFRLGSGEVAVEGVDLQPGNQVRGDRGRNTPGLVDRELAGREAAKAGVFRAADPVLNAIFIGFDVRLPDRYGGFRTESVMAMVALDNALFDPVANPHRIIWVDYGEGYPQNFPTIKVEDEP